MRESQRKPQAFDEARVYVINLMSAPGAGKTSLLETTIKELNGKIKTAVIGRRHRRHS